MLLTGDETDRLHRSSLQLLLNLLDGLLVGE